MRRTHALHARVFETSLWSNATLCRTVAADPVTRSATPCYSIFCTLRILSAYCVKRVGSCAWEGLSALFIGDTTLKHPEVRPSKFAHARLSVERGRKRLDFSG